MTGRWPTPDQPVYIPEWLKEAIEGDTDPKLDWARYLIKNGSIKIFEIYQGEELDGLTI